jgi:hypothetical protein
LTDHDFTQLRYWLDMGIKAIIGIVISMVGLDYRAVKNSLRELEESKYKVSMEVQVIQAELGHIKQRLERMEGKLDKALEK